VSKLFDDPIAVARARVRSEQAPGERQGARVRRQVRAGSEAEDVTRQQPPVEKGSKDDYQMRRALNYLKGLPIIPTTKDAKQQLTARQDKTPLIQTPQRQRAARPKKTARSRGPFLANRIA
jgi:hypothetical protein